MIKVSVVKLCTCIGVRSIAQDGERGSARLATRAAFGRWLGSTFGVDATDSLLSLAPIFTLYATQKTALFIKTCIRSAKR